MNIEKYLRAKIIFPLIITFSFLIFLTHLSYTKTALYSDSRFYYSYTMSWVKDHDIKLNSELLTLTGSKPLTNSKGLAVNTFWPGVSIIWIPAYWQADNFIRLVNLFGNFANNDGLGIIYQIPLAVTSILLATFGLYLIFKIMTNYFPKKTSLITIVALFSTTNLLFYTAVEPLMSHAISFFTTSFFLYYFVNHKSGKGNYFILGLLAGAAGLVRVLNSFLLIIPAIEIGKSRYKIGQKIVFSVKLLFGYLIGFLPQIYIWKLFFNRYIIGPSWGYGFNFRNPHIDYVLFNPQNGLFTLTPVLFFAILGMIFFWKRNKELAFIGLLYFALQLYLVSSWAEYTQGGSFSIRMLVNTYPLLSFGFAEVIDKFEKNFGGVKTIFVIGLLTLLNILLIIRYLLIF